MKDNSLTVATVVFLAVLVGNTMGYMAGRNADAISCKALVKQLVDFARSDT